MVEIKVLAIPPEPTVADCREAPYEEKIRVFSITHNRSIVTANFKRRVNPKKFMRALPEKKFAYGKGQHANYASFIQFNHKIGYYSFM